MNPAPPPRPVGRPRSTEADDAIRTAAIEVFAENGYDGMHVEAVAERAGVAKSTLYRRFPNKEDLVQHALSSASDEVACPHTDALEADLVAMMRHLRDKFASEPMGRAVPELVAAAARHEGLRRIHRRFIAERRSSGITRLRSAVDSGELAGSADAEMMMDQLTGVVFQRSFISGGDLSDSVLDRLVRSVLAGHRDIPRGSRSP